MNIVYIRLVRNLLSTAIALLDTMIAAQEADKP